MGNGDFHQKEVFGDDVGSATELLDLLCHSFSFVLCGLDIERYSVEQLEGAIGGGLLQGSTVYLGGSTSGYELRCLLIAICQEG